MLVKYQENHLLSLERQAGSSAGNRADSDVAENSKMSVCVFAITHPKYHSLPFGHCSLHWPQRGGAPGYSGKMREGGIQARYSGYSGGIQGFSGVFRGIQGYSGVFRRGIQGIQGVFRVFRPLILGFSAGNSGGTSPLLCLWLLSFLFSISSLFKE